jgi:RNA polymerase sigma-70 factor, ECF subfamily
MDLADPSTVLLTRILNEWSAGDHAALERLTPLVYAELHRIAELKMMREQHGHALQPSALVNEAFLRLMTAAPVDWKNRAHFFAHSARIMRNVLVDFARNHQIPEADVSSFSKLGGKEPARAEFLDVDAAVTELANLDPRQAQIVEMRYYGGLSITEVAEVMDISEATVNREWQTARAWLFRRLRPRRIQ